MDMLRKSATDWNIALGKTQIAGLGLKLGDYAVLSAGCLMLFIVGLAGERRQLGSPGELLEKGSFIHRWLWIALTVVMILVWGIYGPGYDPAEFVYMQF